MCSLEELLGVEGSERSEGDGGNWGGLPRPGRLRCRPEHVGPITGEKPGSGQMPGRRRRRPYYRSQPGDNTTLGEGRAAASSVVATRGETGECPKG